MNTQHIDNTLTMVKNLFEEVSTRIEALKPGERLTLSKFCESVAHKYNMTGSQLYPIILPLTRNYPGTKIRHGKGGGLEKLVPGTQENKENNE